MFRKTPPICLCNSLRIVVLPRPTPLHKRTIDPTWSPADRLSKVRFWAGERRTLDGLDIKQVTCRQTIPTPGNLKVFGTHFAQAPAVRTVQRSDLSAIQRARPRSFPDQVKLAQHAREGGVELGLFLQHEPV